jgi:hypothetical protein
MRRGFSDAQEGSLSGDLPWFGAEFLDKATSALQVCLRAVALKHDLVKSSVYVKEPLRAASDGRVR